MLIKPDIQEIFSNLNISEILEEVNNIKEDKWSEWNQRQKNWNWIHGQTQSIPFLWVNIGDTTFKIEHHNTDLELYNKCLPFIDILKKHFVSEVFRMILVKLFAHSEIKPHCDSDITLTECHRCHIPIITNENVYFISNNNRYNLKSGSIYEINNVELHGVKNESDYDRIHIIIDVLSKKQ